MPFHSYLFDYNGVLVDDEAVHLAAFRAVLGPFGIGITDAEYQTKYLGFDDAGAFRAIFQDHAIPCDAARVASLVEAKKPLYLERARLGLVVFQGASALLNHLAKQGAVVGIVSGALRQEIELGLRVLDATASVSFVVSAEDTTACKPDPEGYRIGHAKLANLAGAEAASRVLVIEDSIAGIEAARAANLPCLAVAHSYGQAELWRAGANHVVATLADVDDTLLTALATRVYGDAA
jgi:beta-phosphoglucomutase